MGIMGRGCVLIRYEMACAGHQRIGSRHRLVHNNLTVATDDVQVVKRAEDEDLNKDVRYHVAFIKNPQGRVITDVSLTGVSQPMPIDRQLPEMAMPRV